MAKTKLSIYLIKPEFSANDKLVVDVEKVSSSSEVEGVGTVYIRESVPHVPKWAGQFFGDTISHDALVSSSASALLLARLVEEDCLFAVSFGYGYTMLNPDAITERFGLRVALNACGPNSLRKISRTSLAGNARKTSEQMPRQAQISEFGMDVERDLLEGVTVECDENLLGARSLTGSNSLSLSADADVHSIATLFGKIYTLYEEDAYKQSFAWVDHIAAVKAPAIVAGLENRVVECINSRDPSVWLAVPEIINWEAIEGFKNGRLRELRDDILIDDVLETFGEKGLKDFNQLKKVTIGAVSGTSGESIKSWTAAKCLYGELTYEGSTYCANAGGWYKIDQDYSETINQGYLKTPISKMSFPDYAESGEAEYNEKLVSVDGSHRALLDARSISYGGGRSKIELCDVLCDNGSFIHVKLYSGSATLSHLFNQGLVSAELVKQDTAFVSEANEKVHSVAPQFKMSVGPETLKEVVYGIVTKEPAKRPNIPFFSKVAFDYVKKQYALMGVRVSIKAIHRVAHKD